MKKATMVLLGVMIVGIGVIVAKAVMDTSFHRRQDNALKNQQQVVNSKTTELPEEQQKSITHEDALKIVEEFCATPHGVTVTAYPEYDVVFDGRKFYSIEAVFGYSPAGMFLVDSSNGDIYSANGDLDEDSMPLNH